MSYQSPLLNKHKESSNSNLAGYSSVLLLSTTEEVDEKFTKEKEISTLILKEKGLINEDLLNKIENTSPFVSSTNRKSHFDEEKNMEKLLLNDKEKEIRDEYQSKLKSKLKSDKLNKSFDKQNVYFTNYEDLAKTFEKSANFHPRLNYRGSDYSPQKSIKISDYYSGIFNQQKEERKDSFLNFFELINKSTLDSQITLSPIKNTKQPDNKFKLEESNKAKIATSHINNSDINNLKSKNNAISDSKKKDIPVIQNNFTNYMTNTYMLHPQPQHQGGFNSFINPSQFTYPYYNSPFIYNQFNPQMYNDLYANQYMKMNNMSMQCQNNQQNINNVSQQSHLQVGKTSQKQPKITKTKKGKIYRIYKYII